MSDLPMQVTILKEMFRRVGAVYDPDFVQQPEWYLKYSWTEEEQTDFTKWLTEFLHRKKARFNKYQAKQQAGMFILAYGWTTKGSVEVTDYSPVNLDTIIEEW